MTEMRFFGAPLQTPAPEKNPNFFINIGELWAAIVEETSKKIQNTQNIGSYNAQMQKHLTNCVVF